jgi:dihydropteroate synthase
MGVLNVTPDSFSDGGIYYQPQQAIDRALAMLDEGADILDIGGESTRPGTRVAPDELSEKPLVTADEELRRVMPVIEGVRRLRPDALLSIDTYKASVARAALEAGAEIVNDVSAFRWDPDMPRTCAQVDCAVILMHTRGRPSEWRLLSPIDNIASSVEHELANRLQAAFEAGIHREHIAIDPGFGFGKNFEENFPLLAQLDQLHRLGFPLVAGTSRKSFIGRAVAQRTGKTNPAPDRLYASLAAMVASILQGAHIVRVHDVGPAVQAAAVADQVLAAG